MLEVAFSPDGTRIASASVDDTARVWDAGTGKQLQVMRGHSAGLGSVAFSPDGAFLVTGSDDRTARVWSTVSSEPAVDVHLDRTAQLAISSEGDRAIVHPQSKDALEIWSLRTGSRLHTLTGPFKEVTDATFAQDGKWIATASRDQTARLWDVSTGRELLKIVPHPCLLTCFTVSADGKLAAVGASTGEIGVTFNNRTWNLKLQGHSGGTWALAFSPDGKRLLSGGEDNVGRLWNAQTGRQLLELKGHVQPVRAVAFHPQENRIATGSSDGTVYVWDATQGTKVRGWKSRNGPVRCIQFSPDGKSLVAGDADGGVTRWSISEGKVLLTRRLHDSAIHTLDHSPDGRKLATGSADGLVRVWDRQSGKQLLQIAEHKSTVTQVRFSPDGNDLLTGSRDGSVSRWDVETGKKLSMVHRFTHGAPAPVIGMGLNAAGRLNAVARESGHIFFWEGRSGSGISFGNGAVWHVKVNSDGTWLATASAAGVQLWDVQTGALVRTLLKAHSTGYAPITLSSDDSVIAVANGKDVHLFDTETGRELRAIAAHQASIGCLAFSRDGKQLVTGSRDRRARLWDVETGEMLQEFVGQKFAVRCAAVSPDGTRIVTGAYEPHARVWDARTGNPVAELGDHQTSVESVLFSADGSRIITRDRNRIRIWSAQLRPSIDLKGHVDEIHALAFSPTGKRVVTGSADSTARVWDAHTGKELLVLSGHGDKVGSVAFSQDGSLIATGSQDYTARVWNAETGALKATLKGHSFDVWAVAFSPDNQRLTSWGGGTLTWDLATEKRLPDAKPAPWVNQGASPDGKWVGVPLGIICRLVEVSLDAEEIDRRRLATRINPDRHSRIAFGYGFGRMGPHPYAGLFHLERMIPEDPARKAYRMRDRQRLLVGIVKASPKAGYARRALARASVLLAEDPDRARHVNEMQFAKQTNEPRDLRILGGLLVRQGKVSEAMPLLKAALAARSPNGPPVEELLLAFAYQSSGNRKEAGNWLAQAEASLARYQMPPLIASCLGQLAASTVPTLPIGTYPMPAPRNRPFEWETWHEIEVLLEEARRKIRS